MFKSFLPEANDLELIDAEDFTLLKDREEIYFRLGKTKTKKYIVIQAQYEYNNNKSSDFFQTKLTLNNLQEKSQYFITASNIDDCFLFLKKLFEDKTIQVKDIIKKKILKLVHIYEGKKFDIDLQFKNNDNNYLIRKAYTVEKKIQNPLDINKISEFKNKDEKNINLNIKDNNKEEENKNIINDKDEDEKNEILKKEEEKNEINLEEEVKNKKNKIIEKNNIKDNNIEESNTIDKNDNNNEIINVKEKNNKDKYSNKDKKENDKDNITEENNDINNNENNIINENKNIIVEENNHININNNEKNNEKNIDDDYDIINENININEEIGNKNDEKKKKEIKIINKTKEKKIYENQIKQIDLKEKKNQEDYENNNKIINDNNMNVNELLKRIKKLEEENKKLKNENKDLKEQISQMNYNEEKLKKSEKEKENLKIELQKLKNSLNPKKSEENSRNNNNESNINKRQNTMPVISKIDLYKPKNDAKENHDILDLKNNYINNIKNNTMQNKEKKNHNKINFDSKPPINLKVYKTLTQSSYTRYSLDNCFAAFTSLNDELLLVYSTKFKSLECFDLIKQKYIKTILNAHNGIITTIRHYCPQKINKDLILTGSNGDYCAKIWDIETWECIFNLNKIYSKGNMYSICILFDQYQKESLLFTSSDSDYVKIWGINGNLIKNINKTNNEVYLVDTYYDNKEYKYYLITGEMKCVRSYDLNTHQLFRTYSDNNSFSEHVSAFIYTPTKVAGLTKLVESEFFGSVRIWNFHNGNMIKKMDICRRIPLISMCLWNEYYLLVSCADNTIKLIDFKNNAFIKSFSGHNNEVCTIQKIIHPTYGECLISQGLANEQIKMWING